MEYGDKFKKAVIGGFDRDDVIRCFEEMSAHNAEELERMRKELDREKAAHREYEEKYNEPSIHKGPQHQPAGADGVLQAGNQESVILLAPVIDKRVRLLLPAAVDFPPA